MYLQLKLSFFSLMLLASLALQGTQSQVLPQLVYPKNLVLGPNRMVISDYPHLYLYQLNPFRLIRKIGKRGEGPGEFYVDQLSMRTKLAGLVCSIFGKALYVNSQGRLTIFDLDGRLLEVRKLKSQRSRARGFFKFGDGFVSYKTARVKSRLFSTIMQYNMELSEKREILRTRFWLADFKRFRGVRYNFFERANGSIAFDLSANTLFVSNNLSSQIEIDLYDQSGKKQRTLHYRVEPIPVPKQFSKIVFDYFRYKFKRGLKVNVDATAFPEFFPAMRKFFVDDNRIYAITYRRNRQQNEILVIDLAGKLLKRTFVPIYEANPEFLYPCDIRNGTLYQVLEDDEENWKLNIQNLMK